MKDVRRRPSISRAYCSRRAISDWKRTRWSAPRSVDSSKNAVIAAVALFGLALLTSISARVDAGIERGRGPTIPTVLPASVLEAATEYEPEARGIPAASGPSSPEHTPPGEVVSGVRSVPTPLTDGPSWDPSPTSLDGFKFRRVGGERRPRVREVVSR